jgi:uncharacterized protein YsxB (DUF464 family)
MIHIEMSFDERDLLKSCRVSGHSGAAPKGEDIVCAAVSVLIRTAYTVLSSQKELEIRASALKRGEFQMEIDNVGTDEAFLSAVQMFLQEGFRSVAAEFPHHVKICMERKARF